MNTNSVILNESIKVNTSVNKALYFKTKRAFDILFGIVGVLLMLPLAFIIKAVSIINRDCFYYKSSLYYK